MVSNKTELNNLQAAAMPKQQEKSWLDNILGGLGNFAKSDTGKQMLSGLLTQAVSDQSYGGQTFLAGMQGAKQAQEAAAAKEAAAGQKAFDNKITQQEADAKTVQAKASLAGAGAAGTNAATKANQYGLDTKKYEQQMTEALIEQMGEENYNRLSNKEKAAARQMMEQTGVVPGTEYENPFLHALTGRLLFGDKDLKTD